MAKQAVLLIHGIGEQRPMETLRAFVDEVWSQDRDCTNNCVTASLQETAGAIHLLRINPFFWDYGLIY